MVDHGEAALSQPPAAACFAAALDCQPQPGLNAAAAAVTTQHAAPAVAAPSPPVAASSQPTAAANFAAVVAGLPQPEFSALAAEVSYQHAALQASFKGPLDSAKVLNVAKGSLLLLGVMVSKLESLSCFADAVSRQLRTSVTDGECRATIQEALLALRRAWKTVPARPVKHRNRRTRAKETPLSLIHI